jgi:cytochrome c oxidase subunit 2
VNRRGLLAAALGAAAGLAGLAPARAQGVRIHLALSKFAFSAHEIRVRRGVPVTLVLTTADFPHGFSVPDFNARIDAIPGKAVELRFTPDRAGRFHMLCDNFCGEGHDRMTGYVIVE